MQAALGFAAILLTAVISLNWHDIVSAVLGFSLVLMSTLVYVKIAWSKKVLPAAVVFARHKKAELYKYLTNLVGFALVFILYKQVQILALFTAYIVTLSSYWFGLFWTAKPKS